VTTFAFSVEKWRPWLSRFDSLVDPFPMDLALQWVRMESGGNVCAVGRVEGGHVYEAGLAQTYFTSPSAVKFGVTSAQLRAKCSGTTMPTNLTDADRELQARVAMDTVREARAQARSKLAAAGVSYPESSADFWAFVKLRHALPGLYSYLGPCKRAIGGTPTWMQFRAYVESLTPTQLAAIDAGTARYAGAFDRVWHNCETFASVPAGTSRLLWLVAAGAVLLYMSRRVA
jgi:hypothetical protein